MQMARYPVDPPLTQIGATELSAVGPLIVPLVTHQCKKCSDDYEGFFRSGSIICKYSNKLILGIRYAQPIFKHRICPVCNNL